MLVAALAGVAKPTMLVAIMTSTKLVGEIRFIGATPSIAQHRPDAPQRGWFGRRTDPKEPARSLNEPGVVDAYDERMRRPPTPPAHALRMEASQTLAGPTATRSATLQHLARSLLWQSPAFYLPIAHFRYPEPSPKVIGPETELVIEGYMRSANTYAVHAFQSAQRRPVALAHHLHAPAQLIRAARHGVPALVLIRDPEDTILSQVQWEPDISMRAALMTYVRFYRTLEPYAGDLLTATFPQVTEDFGEVIRRLNTRFGTDFDVYEPTEEHQRLCFELMQERASEVPEWRSHVLRFESGEISLTELLEARRRFPSGPDASSDDAWSPSSSRRRTKEALRRSWNESSLRDLRDRAAALHHAFASTAERAHR